MSPRTSTSTVATKTPRAATLALGYFHIALTNIMGKFKQSFVVDVTAGAEVWNQPVRSYEVVRSELMNPSQASMQYFGTQSYPFNPSMTRLAYVKTRFSYMAEANEDGALIPARAETYTRTVEYEYFLELDANNNIIGGEWLGQSRYKHPDFLWFPTQRPDANAVSRIGLSYKEIRALIDASVACKPAVPSLAPRPNPAPAPVPAPGPTTRPNPVPGSNTVPTNGFCRVFITRESCNTLSSKCRWSESARMCGTRS
ncbi:hypothetical protein PINS_up003368 [Pythium insidiosum]|nr:hypothetical protein PINS_up003368 [Pythium insidiosum]